MKKFTMILMASTAMAISTPAWSANSTAEYADFKGDYAHLSEEVRIRSYVNSKYEWCDVRLVTQYFEWEEGEFYQTKLWIGGRLLEGDARYAPIDVEDALQKSRAQGNYCTFEDTGFTMEDAEMVASAWDLGSMDEAKWKIASLVTQGYRQDVISVVGQAY